MLHEIGLASVSPGFAILSILACPQRQSRLLAARLHPTQQCSAGNPCVGRGARLYSRGVPPTEAACLEPVLSPPDVLSYPWRCNKFESPVPNLPDTPAQIRTGSSSRAWKGADVSNDTDSLPTRDRSVARSDTPVVFTSHHDTKPEDRQQRKAHILGLNARSIFLAHALRSSYGTVELLTRPGPERCPPLTFHFPSKTSPPVPHASQNDQIPSSDDSNPITDLVVTENNIKALARLKHRLDHKSTICFMADGLGLEETAQREVFARSDPHALPQFVLGHSRLGLSFNGKSLAIKRLGRPTYLTSYPLQNVSPQNLSPDPSLGASRSHSTGLIEGKKYCRVEPDQVKGDDLFDRFRAADYVFAQKLPLDDWLRAKLPAMIFSSVVEPVCTILDCRYEQLNGNRRAMEMMDQLIDEMSTIVIHLPELARFPEVAHEFRREKLRKYCLSALRGRGRAPSQMATKLKNGMLVDIDFLNGYFASRGNRLGLDTRANTMMISLVKAKHTIHLKKVDSYIPWERTSRR